MKNKLYLFLSLLILCLYNCSDPETNVDINTNVDPIVVNPSTPINYQKKWSVSTIPSGLSTGSRQGAALFKDQIFQFKNATVDGVKQITYDIYDTKSNAWTKGSKNITCVPENPAGSACFAPQVLESYTKAGNEYHCILPFVFLTGHYNIEADGKTTKYEIIDVVDIDNDVLVRRYFFNNRQDDAIAAYDFDNNKVWIIGYKSDATGMAPYVIQEYNVDLASVTPAKRSFTAEDIISTYTIGGPNSLGYQESLVCGTLQDADYHNGYIYLAVGRGSSYNRTEWARIHAYDLYSHKIVSTTICPDIEEPEGFVIAGGDMYMTTKSLWKLSTGYTYDNKYNFESAKEIENDSYEISNGSQLVWFISQIYNGRTNINGILTSDIDMSEIEDPFTFYIYDTNIADGRGTGGRKFESHYAFRGTFDGQGHTISNFSISKTPYYNNGLFPYVVDATIKNVKITGNIKLTKANHSKSDTFDIQNVGFIGYMNGGTLENIDASEITIDASEITTSQNIGKLVGSGNGIITKKKCVE